SALFAEAPVAARDGLTPSRLLAAGAIIVGKTNLPSSRQRAIRRTSSSVQPATPGALSGRRVAPAGVRAQRWLPASPPSPPRPTAGGPFGSPRPSAGWQA